MFKDSNIYINKNGLWKPVLEQGFWYLHFPGTEGSYVQARDIHDFEIGDQDAEIEISFKFYLTNSNTSLLSTKINANPSYSGYLYRLRSNVSGDYSVYVNDGNSNETRSSYNRTLSFETWYKFKMGWENSTGTLTEYFDGSYYRNTSSQTMAGATVYNAKSLTIGGQISGLGAFHGDIRSFRFNDEHILFEESYGKDTLITNKGTVLDILGDVEWRYQEPIKNVKIYTGLGWKDLIEDEGWYLHFPGTAGSYVEARDIHDFEIGDEDAEIELEFRVHANKVNGIAASTYSRSVSQSVPYEGWFFRTHANGNYEFSLMDGGSVSTITPNRKFLNPDEWRRIIGAYEVDSFKQELILEDDSKDSKEYIPEDLEIKNYSKLLLGGIQPTLNNLDGDIRYFRFNDEEFLMNEGQGTTITGSKGTVMDIKGDVEWRRDNTKSKIKTKK